MKGTSNPSSQPCIPALPLPLYDPQVHDLPTTPTKAFHVHTLHQTHSLLPQTSLPHPQINVRPSIKQVLRLLPSLLSGPRSWRCPCTHHHQRTTPNIH